MASESLWATAISLNRWRIDNLPFFAKGIAWGDVVATTPGVDGEPVVGVVVENSGHSLVTVIVLHGDLVGAVAKEIRALGYAVEVLGSYSLLSVDIRPDQRLEPLMTYLADGEADELLSYCENCLAHD